jgi:lipid A oxidase
LLSAAAPALAEWTAAAYLGGAWTHDSFLRLDRPQAGTSLRLDGVTFEGRSFQSPVYYGYRLGYFWNRRFGVEAEFVHMKVYARTERTVNARGTLRGSPVDGSIRMSEAVSRFSVSHGANFLLGNFVVRQPMHRLTLTGRFGLGPSIPHPETEVDGVFQEQYEVGWPAVQAAAGVEIRLWRRLYWLAEYKFTRSRENVRIPGGTAETLLRSHHGVSGIGIRF